MVRKLEPLSHRETLAVWAVVIGLCSLKALLHLAVVTRYGFHGDELYFIECGRHLAWGYVDHAPLVPWLARLADEVGGASLLTLRLPAIAAGTGTMLMTGLLVREWGGGVRAQILALTSLLVAPANLRMGAMLDIPVVEVFWCSCAAYFATRALRLNEGWAWLVTGALAGLALLTKHTALLWGFGLAVGLLSISHRRALSSAAPWLGLTIALLFFSPNLWWQVQHGFPTLEFKARLRHEVLVGQGRLLFVLGQLLYFHPFVIPVWLSGLVFAFTDRGRDARPFAVLFVVMFLVLLVLGGKPYYLATAYPPLLAGGGIALERWLAHRVWVWRSLAASLALTGAVTTVLSLPLLPLRTVDAVIAAALGWIVPPMALTHDMHGELGWEVHADAINRVVQSLTPTERADAALVVGTYSQAAALNVLRNNPVPRAVSGHMSYSMWGPEAGASAVLIACGLPHDLLTRHCVELEERGRIVSPLGRPWDSDLPIYVCRGQRQPLSELWPRLRRFSHLSLPEDQQ